MKKKQKKILLTMTVVCIITFLMAAGSLIWYLIKLDNAAFVPPEFDAAAVRQEPPQIEDWREVKHTEYAFGVCGAVNTKEGKSLTVWLYNDAENENVWLKLRVKDAKGETIGETGLIKPGEALEKVQLERSIEEDEKITYYVMAYDKDYHSLTPFPFDPKVS